MHTFGTLTKGASRVKVTNDASPLAGKLGTFVRRVTQSAEAWVRMDDELPVELQSPFKDGDPRKLTDIVVFPDEVEAVG